MNAFRAVCFLGGAPAGGRRVVAGHVPSFGPLREPKEGTWPAAKPSALVGAGIMLTTRPSSSSVTARSSIIVAASTSYQSSCRYFRGNFISGDEAKIPSAIKGLSKIFFRSHSRYMSPVVRARPPLGKAACTARVKSALRSTKAQDVAKAQFNAFRNVRREAERKKGAASRT